MSGGAAQLSELMAELARELGVEGQPVDGGVDYAVGDVAVAEVRGGTAAFRLRPDVATAAARTPDGAIDSRGPEWVSFTPRSLDRFARDRVSSWFEFAVRQGRPSG